LVKLHVNVDHVATLREARKTSEPDPVYAALIAEQAGAAGITAHLREDRRHIQDRDIRLLREMVQTRLNLEMGATDEMVGIALKQRPDLCTLVPEKRQEVTTEGGLDLVGNKTTLGPKIKELKAAGIRVSLFIDPAPEQIACARDLGADDIEMHTGEYANAKNAAAQAKELARLVKGAKLGGSMGLGINAGHGLTYFNIGPIAALVGLAELNIGHSIMARAFYVGVAQAVKEMIGLIEKYQA